MQCAIQFLVHYLILFLQNPYVINIIGPIFQMRKLKYNELNDLPEVLELVGGMAN